MKDEDVFDLRGNEPKEWLGSAIDLLTASTELGRAGKEVAQKSEFPEIPFSPSFWPRLMIRAFAIECLLKAHLLRAGKILYKNGELIGDFKNHDLVKLARKANFLTNEVEENLLDRLTTVAVGVGRYPLSSRFDARRKSVQWASRDEINFRSLIIRLVEPLNKQSLNADLLKDA